jgi:hypothetical protein
MAESPFKHPAPALKNPLSFISNPWFYPLLACFLLLVLLSARKIGNYDLGFHLKAGQWILQTHSFPQKDTYTYTQSNRDYLDSNGLYQIVLYFLVKNMGYPSITLLNMGVIFLVFSLLWIRLQATPAPAWGKAVLFLAAILVMERRFIVRPEIFSWFYLSLTLFILESRYKQTRNLLYLLPFIQWFWVNTEGLFMLGWAAMAIYGISGWLHEKRMDRALLKYFLLSIGADFLNSYGYRGLLFPFQLWTRLQTSNVYKQAISEFFSPLRFLAYQNLQYDKNLHIFIFFALALLSMLLLIPSFRQRKFHEFALFAVFLFLALTAVRNIPLFILIDVPFLAICLADWKAKPRWGWLYGPQAPIGLTLLIILLGLRVATNAFYISDRRNDRLGLDLDGERLPVKAVQFMIQNRLDGRMLNDLNFGGWLDWQGPQPTYIDGRLEVPEDSFYQQYRQSFGPNGLIPLLAITQAQLVVMEYNSSIPWADQLKRFQDWRLIYLDGCTAIYARKDYAPQVPTLLFPDFIKSIGIPEETDVSMIGQLQGLRPSKFSTWLDGFYQRQVYSMGTFSMGLFAMRMEEYQAARDIFMEGFRETNGAYGEVFFNLAVASLHLKSYVIGKWCLQYSLGLEPDNPPAVQMLNSLRSY